MVDFIPPQVPDLAPAPLSPTVPLNPPMVGQLNPFDHVDGQNRDQIMEAIRAWARTSLRDWTGAWHDYQSNWYGDIRDWLATWEQATIDYVVGEVTALTAFVNTSVADLTAYVDDILEQVIEDSIQLQDPVLAGIIADAESQARQRLDALYGGTIRLNSTNFPLLVMDGSADMGAVLTGISNALPDTCELEIDGHVLITSTWDLPTGKNITVRGGKITYGGTVYSIIRQTGLFETVLYPTALAKQLASIDGSNRTTHVITLPAAVTWKRGDVVRVFSDDVIPASHITSNTSQPRVGEFATVYGVAGNVVTLSGPLVETYATNIRVARLDKSTRTKFVDVQFDVTDERLAAQVGGVLFRFKSLYAPRIIRPQIARATGICAQFDTCVNALVEQIEAEYATNAPVAGGEGAALGYIVHDSGSMHTRVMGGTATGGRHFFTDGASLVEVATPDPTMYGATIGAEVHGAIGKWFKAAAFDTHHMTKNVRFVDVTVYAFDELPCFTLRGRDAIIINPVAYGGSALVQVVTQDTTLLGYQWSRGESYGHKVINPTTFGTKTVVDASIRRVADHPNLNVRSTVPNLTIQGGMFHGIQSISGALQNVYVQLFGEIYCNYAATAVGAALSLNNTRLTQRGTLHLNGDDVTAVTGSMRLISAVDTIGLAADAGSFISLEKVIISGSDVFSTAFGSTVVALTANSRRFRVSDFIDIDLALTPSTPVSKAGAALAGSDISHAWRSRDRSSGWIELVNGEIAALPLYKFGATDPVLYVSMSINDATARTLDILPAGQFIGQEMRLMSATAVAITVRHGVTGNTSIGADKSLSTVGAALRMTWTGTAWRSLTLV